MELTPVEQKICNFIRAEYKQITGRDAKEMPSRVGCEIGHPEDPDGHLVMLVQSPAFSKTEMMVIRELYKEYPIVISFYCAPRYGDKELKTSFYENSEILSASFTNDVRNQMKEAQEALEAERMFFQRHCPIY